MKKFKKLLSVLLAVVMMLSSFAVLGNAYGDYKDPGDYYYDSNDNPRAYLYTDEQRASIIMDLIDGFLSTLNIHIDESFLGIDIYVDLNSFNGLCDTMASDITGLKGIAGDLSDLAGESILAGGSRESWGDQTSFKKLVEFLGANGKLINNVLSTGLDLGRLVGLIASGLDFTAINETILGLPDMLAGLVYGFGNRQITNGIGNDLKYPNTTAWDDLTGTKPTIDASLQNILYKLLTEPNNTEPTNNPDRNEIITNPEKFGATSAMIHQDENGYYYIYGTKNSFGKWTFTEASTTTDESDRHDICQWKDGSALVKGVAATELKEILNLQSGLTLYQMLEKAIPWAYDTFGGHNLDGQLRATLMQFCGAFNNGDTVDAATKATLQAKVEEYKALEDAADGDKSKLRDEFAAKQGVAGNYNFMYIDLEGKKIGDKTSDSLYYVVEWGGAWEFYHVELGEGGENVNALFDLINWEYQAPMWDTIASTASVVEGESFLLHINDIVGTILKTAMPSLAEGEANAWKTGTADNTLRDNLVALMKVVIKNAKAEIWGEHYELPADFDSYTLEQALVLIAGELLDMLMPQLVLPATVTSVEEVAVYAVREFTAEILPHLGAGWDAKIAEAVKLSGSAKEDEFLDILLNMGTSIGAYYLQNLIGLGTVTTDTSNDNDQETVPMGADYTWREILDYIVDWVLETWLGDLKGNIADDFAVLNLADDPDSLDDDQPLLKLSAIFSKLFPHLVRILGADVDGYALNLEHVYTDVREILNGDFSAVANGLLRDKDAESSANMTLYEAIAQLLIDLFGGLGMEDVTGSWGSLTGLFTTALDTTAPLNKLVGTSSDLAAFARYFVECLCGARERWVDDALIFIAMLLGYESEQSITGIVIEGVENAYTGTAVTNGSATVDYSMTLNAKGVKTYFNNGRYRTNEGALEGKESGFDDTYKIQYNQAWVEDLEGNKKSEVKNYGGYQAEPGAVASDSITMNGITENAEVWTLVTEYQIVAPDGSLGEKTYARTSFVVTSAVNDALSDVTVTFDNKAESNATYQFTKKANNKVEIHAAWTYRNVYISEKEALNKVNETILNLSANNTYTYTNCDPHHTYTKLYVPDYGYHVVDENTGAISVNTAADNTTQVSLSSKTPVVLNGTKNLSDAELQSLWFKWNLNNTAPSSNGAAYTANTKTYASGQMWAVDESHARGDYTDDFYSYAVTPATVVSINYNALSSIASTVLQQKETEVKFNKTFTPYVTLYNSYDLENVVASNGLNKADYDTTSTNGAKAWDEYKNAVTYANNQLYGKWVASSFVGDHQTSAAYEYVDENGDTQTLDAGSSTFEYAGIRLQEAVEALDAYKVKEAESEAGDRDLSPKDEGHELNGIYNELMAMDAKGYKSHNYVLYRWFKFSDLREGIRYVINAATRPEDAKNTLAGVPYDDDVIAGIISQIDDPDVKAIVESLKEAPTEEAIKAANDAINAWLALPLNYDLNTLNTQVADMKTNEGRLISKYDARVTHYLDDALTKYGNVADDGTYTAESYAIYAEKKAEAERVQGDADATQFEIFDSRYHFLVAYNNLVLAKEAVDMTALEDSMAQAQAILDAINTDGEYTLAPDATVESLEEAYKQLVVALGIKVTYDEEQYFVGGNFSGVYAHEQKGMITAAEQQPWVDSITENLNTAIANFEAAVTAVPELILTDRGAEIGAKISTTYGTSDGFDGAVFGVDTLGLGYDSVTATLEEAYTTEAGYIKVNTDNTDGVETTGAVIELYDDNDVLLASYVFIYFGDVNSDGGVDTTDASLIEEYSAMISEFSAEYYLVAGDVNNDETPDTTDTSIIEEFSAMISDMPTQAECAEYYGG